MKPNHSRRDFLKMTALAGAAALARPFPAFAGKPSTPAWQIGCYTRPWTEFGLRAALDGIAQAGYKYAGLMGAKDGKNGLAISVDSTPEEAVAVAGEVSRRGLKTISLYGGDFPVSKSIDAGIAGLKKLIDYSHTCGCPNLLLGGTAHKELFDAYYTVVAECCDYAAAKGVALTIKPHGGENSAGPQCRKIIERVNHKNFRLWYDAGNVFYYSDGKIDPVADTETVDGLVAGMCVKDFLPPKNVMVTPGTGKVDFVKLFKRLEKGGFRSGPLVLECVELGDEKKVTAHAKEAREFLERLVGVEA